MPLTVADAAIAIGGDLTGYDRSLVDAERRATTAGERITGAVKGVAKAGLTVVAAGAGVALKGLLELDAIQADFAASTGATADEAARAGKAINEMAGRNLQPMREIGRALAKVNTDLGLTGAAAEETTERFLRFARATKQDAADAVVAFDDILDAWGLTADDAQRVMDNLVASNQKYGGSIEENQRSLAVLAPQLRALNFDIDDGQALLNLFAASGLDASKAQFALNSAIQNMPPGQTFDDLVAQISAIEDPAERARAAIEIFGARGGAGLANVLQPGIDSLDDFARSEQEIVGSSDEAAAAIDSSFGARVQLLLKGFTSRLIEAGQAFGPLLTGVGALASLGATLGVDRLFDRLARTGPVRAAAAAAGGVLGTIFSGAMFVAQKLASLASAALLGATAQIAAAAAAAGATAGTAFALAAVAAIVGAPLAVLAVAIKFQTDIDRQTAALQAQARDFAKNATQAELDRAIAGVQEQLDGMVFNSYDSKNKVIGVLNTLIEESNRRAAELPQDVATSIDAGLPEVEGAGSRMAQAFTGKLADDLDTGAIAAGAAAMRAELLGQTQALIDEMSAKGATLAQISATLAAELPRAVEAHRGEVRRQALLSMVDYAAGLRDKRGQIEAAIELLGSDLDNALSRRAEAAKLTAALAGENIAKGLASKDPLVRAQAEGTVALIADRLMELEVDAGKLGGAAGKNYADAMKGTAPLAGSAATNVANAGRGPLRGQKDDAYVWGANTGNAYADGIASTASAISNAAKKAAGAAKFILYASSPPGPQSPLHEIDVWGRRTFEAWADGILAAIPSAIGSARTLAIAASQALDGSVALGSPALGRLSLAPTDFLPEGGLGVVGSRFLERAAPIVVENAGGTTRINNNYVAVEGLLKARDSFEVGDNLQRLAEAGVLDGPPEYR